METIDILKGHYYIETIDILKGDITKQKQLIFERTLRNRNY